MINFKSNAKGLALSLLLGLIAYFAADFVHLNKVILGFVVGVLAGNIFKPSASFKPGIKFSGSKFLEISIILLAFSINYANIAKIGPLSFGVIAVMVLSMVFVTILMARLLKCPGSTGWLIGFGTAVCGSSAIAALAPSVTEDEADIGIAMAVTNLLGSVFMLLFPFIFTYLHVNDFDAAFLLGGSLHSVGNVAGAAYGMSDTIGQSAITIKLARVAMLSPALLLFNFMVNREKGGKWTKFLKLPWYLWLFIAITILVSLVQLPESLLSFLENAGKLTLTIAMTAIGLNVSLQTLLSSGKKGIVFGLVIFALQLIFLVVVLQLL